MAGGGGGAIVVFAPGHREVTQAEQAPPTSAEAVRAAALARQAFPESSGDGAVIVVTRTDHGGLTPRRPRSRRPPDRRPQCHAGRRACAAVAFDPARSVSPNGTVALLNVIFEPEAPTPDAVHRVARPDNDRGWRAPTCPAR